MQPDYMTRIKRFWHSGRRRLEGGVSSIALRELGASDAALRAFKGKHDYLNYLMQGIHNMDSRAIVSIAKAVEAEMADGNMEGVSQEYWMWYGLDPSTLEKDSPEYWKAFNERADYIVRRTQPMFHGEHKSMLTSDPSSLARSFAMFRSYVDQPIRMAHRNVQAYNNGTITGQDLVARSVTIWAGLAAYEVIRALISKGMFGGDDDEIDLMLNIVTAPTKVMAFIGFPAQKTLRELIDNKLTGDPIQLRYADLSPLPIQFANDVVSNTSDLARAMGYSGSKERFKSGQNKGKLKSEVYFYRAIYGIMKNTLRYNGIPAVQIDRMLKNIDDKD